MPTYATWAGRGAAVRPLSSRTKEPRCSPTVTALVGTKLGAGPPHTPAIGAARDVGVVVGAGCGSEGLRDAAVGATAAYGSPR